MSQLRLWLFEIWRQRRRFGIRAFNAFYRGLKGIIPSFKHLLKDNLPEATVNFLANNLMPEKRRSPRNRRYIRTGLSRVGLLREMERRNVRYVLLRWFEGLPDWPEGEDMDFLVHSEDIEKIQDLFTLAGNDMPVDLFSHDGSKGLSYSGLPYYPLPFSERLLKGAVLTELRARVPNFEMYFASLAYHAVYHKFYKSGLPLESGGDACNDNPENPYPELLSEMARTLGLELDCSLVSLHAFLHENQLAPTFDLMRKLEGINPHLSPLMNDTGGVLSLVQGEVIAFVVRQWTLDNGLYEDLRKELQVNLKLEILTEIYLDGDQKQRANRGIRGGDWGKGPHKIAGGGPAVLLLCFDYHPVEASSELKLIHPHIRNANISRFKGHLRKYVEERVLITKHANPIHSSDDEYEAWQYAEIIAPDETASLKERVSRIRKAYETVLPVIDLLPSHRRRAKLEVVDFDGIKAVKKTFRLSELDYFQRELEILSLFSKKSPLIPGVLARGDNYFIIPYFENALEGLSLSEQDRILKGRGAEIVSVLKLFYDEGYALMDFNRNNVLITPQGNLVIIDFEYAHQYIDKPENFCFSYDIVGVPKKNDGSYVDGLIEPCLTYKDSWEPILGPLDKYLRQLT